MVIGPTAQGYRVDEEHCFVILPDKTNNTHEPIKKNVIASCCRVKERRRRNYIELRETFPLITKGKKMPFPRREKRTTLYFINKKR